MGSPFTVYNSIKTACFNGSLSRQEMQKDIAALQQSGFWTTVGGTFGLVVTYNVIWRIPYAGPIIGLISGAASTAFVMLGIDIQTAAKNIKEKYVDNHQKEMAKSILNKGVDIVFGNDTAKKKFDEGFLETAKKGTYIFEAAYNFALASS